MLDNAHGVSRPRRERHEGPNQVAGDANARVGAGVDRTDQTARLNDMTRTQSSHEYGVRTEPCAFAGHQTQAPSTSRLDRIAELRTEQRAKIADVRTVFMGIRAPVRAAEPPEEPQR